MQAIFDTLKYTKGAEAIGIKREHAEYQAQQMALLINDTLATKQDLIMLKNDLIIKIGGMLAAYSLFIISVITFVIKH